MLVSCAEGILTTTLLAGILPLFELDSDADLLVLMATVEGDTLDPQLEICYVETVRRFVPTARLPIRIDRKVFYERSWPWFLA